MLLLGHAGITFGAALAADMVRNRLSGASASQAPQGKNWKDPIRRLSHTVDLRLLLIGSLLPDIIDKPLGLLLLPSMFGGGRLFAHTLWFTLFLTVCGLALCRSRNYNGVLTLAYGSAMHLMLDSMWRSPAILLWPLLGPMPTGTPDRWFERLLENLAHNPQAYAPEIVGAIIGVPLVWALFRRGGLRDFLRTGTVG